MIFFSNGYPAYKCFHVCNVGAVSVWKCWCKHCHHCSICLPSKSNCIHRLHGKMWVLIAPVIIFAKLTTDVNVLMRHPTKMCLLQWPVQLPWQCEDRLISNLLSTASHLSENETMTHQHSGCMREESHERPFWIVNPLCRGSLWVLSQYTGKNVLI